MGWGGGEEGGRPEKGRQGPRGRLCFAGPGSSLRYKCSRKPTGFHTGREYDPVLTLRAHTCCSSQQRMGVSGSRELSLEAPAVVLEGGDVRWQL